MRWIGRTEGRRDRPCVVPPRSPQPPRRRSRHAGARSICRQRGVWLDSTSTISSTVRPGWIGQVTSSTDRTGSALRSRSTMARMTSPTVRRRVVAGPEVSRPAWPGTVDRQQAPLRHDHQQRPVCRCVPELERRARLVGASMSVKHLYRLIFVLHGWRADVWSCELGQSVGNLPDEGCRCGQQIPRLGRKRQADEFAPTLDDCVHDVFATGLGQCDVRRSSVIVRPCGRHQPLGYDAAHEPAC